MKKIGVAVQGPSDFVFWNRVLHKHIAGVSFSVRDLKSQQKLAAAAGALAEGFRNSGYDALFLLLDADKSLCVADVRASLDEPTRNLVGEARENRWVFLSVAFRELETWYCADPEALSNAVEAPVPPEITGVTGGEAALSRFFREKLGRTLGLNKRDLAARMSLHFEPARARKNSASFHYFWSSLEAVLSR